MLSKNKMECFVRLLVLVAVFLVPYSTAEKFQILANELKLDEGAYFLEDHDAILLNSVDDVHANGVAFIPEELSSSFGMFDQVTKLDFKLLTEKDNSCDYNDEAFLLAFGSEFHCAFNHLANIPPDVERCTGVYLYIMTNKRDENVKQGVYLFSGHELKYYWEQEPSWFINISRITVAIKPGANKRTGDTVLEIKIDKKALPKVTYTPSDDVIDSRKVWFMGTTEEECGASHEVYDFWVKTRDDALLETYDDDE